MHTAWMPGSGDDTDSLCFQNIWAMAEKQEQAIWLIWLFAILFFGLSVLVVKSTLCIERIVALHDIETPTELTK